MPNSPFLRPVLFVLAVTACSLLLFLPDMLHPFQVQQPLSRLNWPAPDWQLAVTPSCSRIQFLVLMLDRDPGELEIIIPHGQAQRFRLRNARPLTPLSQLGDILTGSWPEIHGLVLDNSLDSLPPFDLFSTLRKRGISSEWVAPRWLGIPPPVRWHQFIDRPVTPSTIPWKPGVNPGFRMAVIPSGLLSPDELGRRVASGLTGQADPREIRMVLLLHSGSWLDLYVNHAGPSGTGDRHDLAVTLAQLLGAPPPPAGFGSMLPLAIPDRIQRAQETALAAVRHQQRQLFPTMGDDEKVTEHLAKLAIRDQLPVRFITLLVSMVLLGTAGVFLRRQPGGGRALAALPLLLALCGLTVWIIPIPGSLEALLPDARWQQESLVSFLIAFLACLGTLVILAILDRRDPRAGASPFRARADRDSLFLGSAFLVTSPYFLGLVWTTLHNPVLLPDAVSLTFLLRFRFLLIGILFSLAAQVAASLLRKEHPVSNG